MASNIKHNKSEKKGPKYWMEEYTNLYTQRKHPISILFIERIAEELVLWAKNDKNAFKLSQFYLDKGIPHSTFHYLLGKHKTLKEAYESARLIIGNRREIGAIKNNYNVNMISSRQHAYDPDWKKDAEWRNELRIKAHQKGDTETNYTIVFEDFGEKEKKDHLPED